MWQGEGKSQINHQCHTGVEYIPVPTNYCDLCKDRVATGEQPSCVLHCLASVMEYGPVEEPAKKMAAKGKEVNMFVP